MNASLPPLPFSKFPPPGGQAVWGWGTNPSCGPGRRAENVKSTQSTVNLTRSRMYVYLKIALFKYYLRIFLPDLNSRLIHSGWLGGGRWLGHLPRKWISRFTTSGACSLKPLESLALARHAYRLGWGAMLAV